MADPAPDKPPAPPWSLYLLRCQGEALYTGITTDVERRYREHCAGKGAKFTRSRPPLALLSHVLVGTRSDALKLEYAVKQLPRARKLAFVQSYRPAGLDAEPCLAPSEIDPPHDRATAP